jgi:hypothetical protein
MAAKATVLFVITYGVNVRILAKFTDKAPDHTDDRILGLNGIGTHVFISYNLVTPLWAVYCIKKGLRVEAFQFCNRLQNQV